MDARASLIASAPVLLVKNVAAAAEYYRDKLGFDFQRMWGEPASFVILHRDGMYVMLQQAEDPRQVVPHWTLLPKLANIYFWVSDVEGLYGELMARGAILDYGLCDQPYGCREFGVRDLDDYDLSFGQTSEPGR